MGKIFIKMLTRRIDQHMRARELWKINQRGYKPDHRTEDNLFILKSLHEKYYVAENKNVYAAFVDKFFLFNKQEISILQAYEIRDHWKYKIIKSMYSNARYRVLVGGKISPNFPSNLGVKQGCPMSPILSNIFQNDMHDIFRDCDPVKLGDTALNSLLWADDLLLLSLSKEGLQKCLNNLREYCQKWALTVNGEKTKVMIFSKGKSVKANLTFGTNEIECVNNFHYLGFQISHDMKLKTIIDDRHSKATKMSKMVLRALRTSTNVSTKLLMSLFDKQIAPILLYGSSIWGIPSSHNLIYLDNLPEVGNTRTTASKTLHETCGCDIPFTSARRVGKASSNGPRRILISLTNVQDKETVLSIIAQVYRLSTVHCQVTRYSQIVPGYLL